MTGDVGFQKETKNSAFSFVALPSDKTVSCTREKTVILSFANVKPKTFSPLASPWSFVAQTQHNSSCQRFLYTCVSHSSMHAYLEDTDNHCHGPLNVCRRWATPTDTRGTAVFHIWLIALRRTFHLHYIIDNKYVPASLMQDSWRPPAYIFFSRPTTRFFVATTLWQAGRRRERRHISRSKEKWVLNGPLSSLPLVIQICHAVHTLYNAAFLCFSRYWALLCLW